MGAVWKTPVAGNPNVIKFTDASTGRPMIGWMTSAGNGGTGRPDQYDAAPASSNAMQNLMSGRSQLTMGGMPVTGSSQPLSATNPAQMYDLAKATGRKNPFQGGRLIVTSSDGSGGGSGGQRSGGGGGSYRRGGGGGSSSDGQRQKIHGVTQAQNAADQAAREQRELQEAERGNLEWNARFRDTSENRLGVKAGQAAGLQTTLESEQDKNWRTLEAMGEDPQAQEAVAREKAWRLRFGED